jgi:hypothetical protein
MIRIHGHRKLALCFSLGACLLVAIASSETAVAKIHNDSSSRDGALFEAYNPATGAYTPLERVVPSQTSRDNDTIGGLEFPSNHSSVRLHAGDPIVIVTAAMASGDNPGAGLYLFSLKSESASNTRFLPVMQLKVFRVLFAGIPGKTQYIQDHSRVDFTIGTVGKGRIKIIPTKSLPPGEYSVGESGNPMEYCFGVDPT